MKGDITISFTGDFCPINRVDQLIKQDNFSGFSEIANLTRNQDLVVANLECPLTDSNKKIIKVGPNLKSSPAAISLINYLNINIIALANNHILDYGDSGIRDTIRALDNNEIQHLGAGNTLEDAKKPLVLEVKGKKIGFLNVCETEFSIAGATFSGANPNDLVDVAEEIYKQKKQVDILILIYHGGLEYYNLPTPSMQKTLRFYVRAGADLIVCHHSHTIGGYEIYNNTPIFYGLGNFTFDWKSKPEFWHESIILNLIIKEDNKITFDIIPILQCKNEVGITLISGSDRERIFSEIQRLSNIIVDKMNILKSWELNCLSQKKSVFANIFSLSKNHRRLIRRGLLPNLYMNRRTSGILFNQFYCESHRDVMFEILKKEIYESRNL